MADALDFQADFSQLIGELLKVNDSLGAFDLKAESVIEVVSRVNASTGLLQHSLSALGPDGAKVVVLFDQIEAAGAKLANIGGPLTGALDVVSQSIKRIGDTDLGNTQRGLDISALTSLAGSSASSLGGSSGTLTQSNAFSNQIEVLQQAAERAKVPLDALFALVGQSQGQLAGTTGATRDFANALFNLNQIAINTKVGDFADQVGAKFAPGTPTGISAQQQADLTASARAVGDAAAKAGLDTNGLDSILNQSADALAKVSGEYFKVAQAVLSYREELNKVSQVQVDSITSAANASAAQNATANAKTAFGGGPTTGTSEEIAKATAALAAFQREAEKTGLSEAELNKITEDFRNGIVNEDLALANLNKTLAQVQITQRNLGSTQAAAVAANDLVLQKQQQMVVAATAISQIKADFPIPPAAAPEAVAAYAAALAKLQTQISNSNLSAADVKKVFDASVAGTGQVFEGEAAKIQSSVNGVISSYSKLSEATGKLSQDMKDFISRVGSQIVTILTTQLTHAFQQGIVESQKFSVIINQSAAITASAGNNYAQFADQVTNLSSKFGIARTEVGEGLFQTLKHDVGDAATSFNFLNQAAQFSRVANAGLVDSVQLGTAALNSFNLSASEADKVFAILFAGIKRGRLSVGELSGQLGNLGVIASEVGVSLAETVSALDALTHSGVNAANAQTFLRNFMKALVTPTKEMQNVLDSYGFATGKAAVETLGLRGVLELLAQTANGNINETGKLTSNLRAIQATLGLTGEKMQVFVKVLKQMEDSSKDFSQATDVTFKNTGQIIAEFLEAVTNTSKKISSFFLDNFADIIKSLGGAQSALKAFQAVLIGFSVAVFVANIGTVVSAISTFTAVLVANTVAALANPFVLAGIAIGLVAFSIVSAFNAAEETMKRQQERIQALKDEIVKDQNAIADAIKQSIEAQTRLVNLGVANIQTAYHKIAEIIKEEFEETSTHLKNLFDSDVKHRNEAINKLKSEITKAQGEISNLEKEKQVGVLTIQDRIFEEKLKTLTLTSQIEERDQRAQDLIHAAITDNANAQKAAANGKIEDSIRLEQVSKREFEDASKQLDKIAQATLKVKDLSKGYTSALIDFIKKDFELEVKLINETEKKVLDSFKRVKDAVKDIRDKTGDFSGDSTKFLRGITKELSTYLNQLRGANGRVRIDTRNAVNIDPALGRLLDALDPKTVKKLRFAIESRNQEDVDRILKDVETVQKKLDEVAKARAAYNAEQQTIALARAARNNNDFENERKFLKDSLDFSVKSQAEGFRSGNQVRQDMAGIETRLLQSFKDEATIKGEVKKREDETFRLLVQQSDVEGKQLRLMQDQVTAQTALQKVLQKSSDVLDADRKNREAELASVRTLFQEIDKLRPGKDGIVSAETVKRANELREQFLDGKEKFKFFDPALFAQEFKEVTIKRDELERLANAQRTKSELEEARVGIEAEGKLREQAERAVNDRIALERQGLVDGNVEELKRLQTKYEELKISIFGINNPVNLEDPFFQGAKAGDQGQAGNFLQVKAQLDALVGKIKNDQTPALQALSATLAKLKEAQPLERSDFLTLSSTKLSAEAVEQIVKTSQNRSLEKFAELQKVAENFGFLLAKPFELKVRNEQALGAIETIRQKLLALQDAGQFQIEFKKVQAEGAKPGFFHGGVVYGPNGIDAVPAMLSAGETVIDAKNSSRFFNQIMQIRAGQAPTTSNSSVNFGGVNINLHSSGNAKIDARELSRELKRLESRGVI